MIEGKSPDLRKQTGKYGEQVAADFLIDKDYCIIARNWRCRSGEIDLIAEKDGVLVFIEVRTRRKTGRFGTAKESVGFRKQMQVRQTAQVYMYQNAAFNKQVRMDVISVELTPTGELTMVEHIIGAF
ncbi:YraN family protein [Paenibacillus sp. KN14-4R]|uniref:YraN family protein n=1 Tax=Paenibacillus sp. KN14-4R TaxID=3445773 RepID=UPI003F9FD811